MHEFFLLGDNTELLFNGCQCTTCALNKHGDVIHTTYICGLQYNVYSI